MSENKNSTIFGLTFLQVLFLVFLVLKLTGKTVVATWSWWWVTLPLWGGFAIILVTLIIVFIITLIIAFLK